GRRGAVRDPRRPDPQAHRPFHVVGAALFYSRGSPVRAVGASLHPLDTARSGKSPRLDAKARIQLLDGGDRLVVFVPGGEFGVVAVSAHVAAIEILHHDAVTTRQDGNVLVVEAVIYFRLWDQPGDLAAHRGDGFVLPPFRGGVARTIDHHF